MNFYNFRSHITHPHKIIRTSGERSFYHRICGYHDHDAICPNCHEKLLLILSLDTLDPALHQLNYDGRFLNIYYCFKCEIIYDKFYFQIINDNKIEVLNYQQNTSESQIEWMGETIFDTWKQLEYYPEMKFDLVPATDEEKKLLMVNFIEMRVDISLINPDWKLDYFKNGKINIPPELEMLVGGLPDISYYLEQDSFVCPICYSEMPFLAVIKDDYIDDRGEIVSITRESIKVISAYCSNCKVVGVINHNDS